MDLGGRSEPTVRKRLPTAALLPKPLLLLKKTAPISGQVEDHVNKLQECVQDYATEHYSPEDVRRAPPKLGVVPHCTNVQLSAVLDNAADADRRVQCRLPGVTAVRSVIVCSQGGVARTSGTVRPPALVQPCQSGSAPSCVRFPGLDKGSRPLGARSCDVGSTDAPAQVSPVRASFPPPLGVLVQPLPMRAPEKTTQTTYVTVVACPFPRGLAARTKTAKAAASATASTSATSGSSKSLTPKPLICLTGLHCDRKKRVSESQQRNVEGSSGVPGEGDKKEPSSPSRKPPMQGQNSG